MSSLYPQDFALECGPVSAVDLALFAAAAGDHNPLHLDPDVASAAGFERPVVHGMLTMAYVGRLLTRQFGPGCVRALRTKFTGVALRGDRLVLRASLNGVQDGIGHYSIVAQTWSGAEVVAGEAKVVAHEGI
jgi:acyl dehydratase